MFQGIKQIEAFWKCLMLFIVILLAWYPPAPVYAHDVTLQWDENTETDLAGYKVYYKTETSGPPYNGTGAIVDGSSRISPIDVGDRNTTEITLPDLYEDVTYYFVVTAYNTAQLESGFSNEVSYLVASLDSGSNPPPSPPPPSNSQPEDDYDGDGIPDSEDPDDDNDGLSDIWEEAYGLDPLDSTGVNGRNGDFDSDGWSNYGEYKNETDPADSTSLPSLDEVHIVETIPIDGAGVNDDYRVPNNTSFSIRIDAPNGIDLTDTASVVFTVKEGSNAEYTRDLSDIDVVRVISINGEADISVSHLWVSYDRAEESGMFYPYSNYVYDTLVTIKVDVMDREGFIMEQAFVFEIETEMKYTTAQESADFFDISTIDPEDPDLVGEYDAGIRIDSGDLAGARIIYSSDEPLEPTFAFSAELPPLDVEGVKGVGIPLVLQPHVVFATPVKIFIPCPGYSDLSELFVVFHNGEEWVSACDENGEILPGGEGWMVPGSRVDHINGDSSTIEIQVYHFSAVQLATDITTDPIPEVEEDIVEDIVEEVEDNVVVINDVEETATTGGGGGGCFIGTATASISNKELHTYQEN